MSLERRLRRQDERAPRGSVRCEKHGLQPLVQVCEHASDGFGAARLEGGARDTRYILCPECAQADVFDREVCQKCIEEELGLDVGGGA